MPLLTRAAPHTSSLRPCPCATNAQPQPLLPFTHHLATSYTQPTKLTLMSQDFHLLPAMATSFPTLPRSPSFPLDSSVTPAVTLPYGLHRYHPSQQQHHLTRFTYTCVQIVGARHPTTCTRPCQHRHWQCLPGWSRCFCPCRSIQPGTVHLGRRPAAWPLACVCGTNPWHSPPLPTGIGCLHQRPPRSTATERMLHTPSTQPKPCGWPVQCATHHHWYCSTAQLHRAHTSLLRRHPVPHRTDPHGPHQPVPHNIQPRQQLHPCGLWLWQQWDSSCTTQESLRWSHPRGIQANPHPPVHCGTMPPAPTPWQRGIPGPTRLPHHRKCGLSAHPTTRSPPQRCQMSNSYFQEPLHCWPVQHRQGLSPPSLGLTLTSSGTHSQLTPTVTHQPVFICMGATSWSFRFQPNTHCPARHPCHHPRQARGAMQLGPPRDWQLVPRACPPLLPLLHSVGRKHPGPAYHWHCSMVAV